MLAFPGVNAQRLFSAILFDRSITFSPQPDQLMNLASWQKYVEGATLTVEEAGIKLNCQRDAFDSGVFMVQQMLRITLAGNFSPTGK